MAAPSLASPLTQAALSSASQRQPRRNGGTLRELPLAAIHRPLVRQTDPAKVADLMASIDNIGLQEPIDVLEVDGQFYGFSGCHRYEAFQRLGRETIPCRVRQATPAVLKMHLA